MPSKPSPPSRGAWIEIGRAQRAALWAASPPSRGAWIEIRQGGYFYAQGQVAPLAGGVD